MEAVMNKLTLLFAISIVGGSIPAFAQQLNASQVSSTTQVIEKHTPETNNVAPVDTIYSKGELEQLLAPIALYPDSLLTHILIASTYPLEIIEAERWLKDHKGLNADQVVEQAQDKDWDPSVKALLPFEPVLEKLSSEISWTQQLGDAFLGAEEQVLASIQTLRAQADEAGNLAKMENTTVTRVEKTIIIQPSTPEVIYVPYYDTRVVYGPWHWSHYPPVYWVHPIHHHPRHHSPYYWHTPVHVSVGILFGGFHWHNHHVIVRHDSHYYHHHGHKKPYKGHSKKHYSKGKKHYSSAGRKHAPQGEQRWKHNAKHRKGVAYRHERVARHYKSNRPSTNARKVHRSNENKAAASRYVNQSKQGKAYKTKFNSPSKAQVKAAKSREINERTIKMRQDNFKQKVNRAHQASKHVNNNVNSKVQNQINRQQGVKQRSSAKSVNRGASSKSSPRYSSNTSSNKQIENKSFSRSNKNYSSRSGSASATRAKQNYSKSRNYSSRSMSKTSKSQVRHTRK